MGDLGFVGPLTEVDQDRCPLCGLHPTDPTLHADDCPTVTQSLCGVIEVGRMCMAPEHMPPRMPGRSLWDPVWQLRWSDGHRWVALEDVTPPEPEPAQATADQGRSR